MATKDGRYDIEIDIKDSGNVFAKMEKLTGVFMTLDQVIKEVNKDLMGQAKTGTADHYNEEIKNLTKLRDMVADTSEEYKYYNEQIAELTARREALNAPMEGTLAFYELEIKKLRQLQRETAAGAEEYAKFEAQIAEQKVNIDNLTNSQSKNSRSNKNMISNAGLAGATLTELGRTVSDANYGIKGMANNLSQLSTLFITLISKTGGAKEAISLLLDQIRGPLGWILVFQVAVTALEAFSNSQDKTKDAVEKTSDAIKEQIGVVNALLDSFEDENKNLLERIDIIKAIKEVDKDLGDALEKNLFNEKERNKIADARRRLTQATYDLEVKGAETNEKLQENGLEQLRISEEIKNTEELMIAYKNAGYQISSDWEDQLKDKKDDLIELQKEESKLIKEQSPLLAAKTQAEEAYKDLIDEQNEKEVEHSDILRDLQDELTLSKLESFEKERKAAEFTLRDTKEKIEQDYKDKLISHDEYIAAKLVADNIYSQKLKEIQNDENDWRIENAEKNLKEAEALQRDFEKRKESDSKDVLKKTQDFFRDEAIAQKKALDGQELTKKEYSEKVKEIDQKLLQDQIEVIQMAVNAGNIIPEAGLEAIRALEEKLASITGGKAKDKKEMTAEEIAQENADNAQKSIDAIEQVAQQAFDNAIAREERKTALINNELRKRLENEQLSAKQREAINKQIAANDAQLQKNRDKIAEKSFKVQKALNIAQALLDTYRNGWLAFGSQLVIGDPKSLLSAKIAQSLTIAAGLANVGLIASQQFVPSATSVPSFSGGTAGATVQPPDFNIVGASQQTLLADAVSSKLSQPVKAYVVSKDITTAQEMDRNTVSSATL